MKHLKIIFLLLFINPATIKAQTKEETLQWLNLYCRNNIFTNFKDENKETIRIEYFEYEMVVFIEDIELTRDEILNRDGCKYYIPYKDIYLDGVILSNRENNQSKIDILSNSIKIACDRYVKGSSFNESNAKGGFTNQCQLSFKSDDIFHNKNEFANQFCNAIIHLAKLSGAKNKPNTTKDMFK